MSCYIFDGNAFAKQKEELVRSQVEMLSKAGKTIRIQSFVFTQDSASVLYTKLKKSCAQRVGIEYQAIECSFDDSQEKLVKLIEQTSKDESITGVMVQKPSKFVWLNAHPKAHDMSFTQWWEPLVQSIGILKDIDCLHPDNLAHVGLDPLTCIPATVRACVEILEYVQKIFRIQDRIWKKKNVLILGRSDIVGRPLYELLVPKFESVEIFGKDIFAFDEFDLHPYGIIISATGSANLVTGETMQPGCIVVDVGSPKGDIDRKTVEPKASFLTPVPGGVGPVTVISLMENALDQAKVLFDRNLI